MFIDMEQQPMLETELSAYIPDPPKRRDVHYQTIYAMPWKVCCVKEPRTNQLRFSIVPPADHPPASYGERQRRCAVDFRLNGSAEWGLEAVLYSPDGYNLTPLDDNTFVMMGRPVWNRLFADEAHPPSREDILKHASSWNRRLGPIKAIQTTDPNVSVYAFESFNTDCQATTNHRQVEYERELVDQINHPKDVQPATIKKEASKQKAHSKPKKNVRKSKSSQSTQEVEILKNEKNDDAEFDVFLKCIDEKQSQGYDYAVAFDVCLEEKNNRN